MQSAISPQVPGVAGAVDLVTDTLLSHLSHEEHQFVEPLARHGYGFG